jgi:type II secretory pathway pseudopilin PulG
MSFHARSMSAGDGQAGSALVAVLLGAALLSALAAAALLLATSDTLAAARQRDARIALYAAEAALERAASELSLVPDWTPVLSGALTSIHVDGPPSAAGTVPGGETIVPGQLANLATCGIAAGCSAAACAAVTEDRPWGANNPWWRPYAYGAIDSNTPSQAATYVVVLVGDDPSENDGDPARDGTAPDNPGAGVIFLRAEAFGPGGSRRIVDAAVARVIVAPGVGLPRVLSWREAR